VRCRYFRAFGLVVESGFALPGVATTPGDGYGPRVSIQMVAPEQLLASWSGSCGPPDWKTVLGDGITLQHETGLAGDQRFTYGSDMFLITRDGATVLCSVEHPDDVRWQRQLLDTILFSVSFANGFELLHASSVAIDDGLVAFVAPSGTGKSSIAVELSRRGCRIFSDDVLAIGQGPDGLTCHPGPAVMNVPRSAGLPVGVGAGVIAAFPAEDEVWITLERAATSPRPLRAVYRLDRSADSSSLSPDPAPTVLDLLPHAISLPHGPARARRRFELFSALADQVAMFQLAVDSNADPRAIADLVETSLGCTPSRLAVA
jgi:hypothetical protein